MSAATDRLVETVREKHQKSMQAMNEENSGWASTRVSVTNEEFTAALDGLVLEHTRQQAIIDRLMEAGVETWHTTVNDEPALFAWLGLTWEEYGAWVEGGVPALVALSPPPVASGGEQK